MHIPRHYQKKEKKKKKRKKKKKKKKKLFKRNKIAHIFTLPFIAKHKNI